MTADIFIKKKSKNDTIWIQYLFINFTFSSGHISSKKSNFQKENKKIWLILL